jgi:hypothetical protein
LAAGIALDTHAAWTHTSLCPAALKFYPTHGAEFVFRTILSPAESTLHPADSLDRMSQAPIAQNSSSLTQY